MLFGAGRKPEFKWFEWFCLEYHIQYQTRRINLYENLHFIRSIAYRARRTEQSRAQQNRTEQNTVDT